MSNTDQTQDEETSSQEVDELSLLKQRASLMGIKYSNNISIEKLRERINGKLVEEEQEEKTATSIAKTVEGKALTLRQKLIKDNMRLIRLRITNLDPKKKDLPGEIITVANEHLGTVRKFVPFGETTENGYHVPYCIYNLLRSRKFLNIRTFKDRQNPGQIKIEQSWSPEFALDVLPPLTQEELDKLATAQSAAGGIG